MRLTSIIGALSLSVATSAAAQDLVFATTNIEQSPINADFLIPWAEKISESDAINIELRHGPTIANHTNFYDRVIDGVVDISWGVTAFNPGKFPNTLVMSMPFYVENSQQGALAACRMYEAGAFGNDFEGIRPLLFAQFPHSYLHTTETPITDGLDTMEGLKIIALSPGTTNITKANGGTPVSVGLTEAFEALQRGAADGMIMSFTAFSTFRLGEQLKHHYKAPLGGALGVVFISDESYNALPDEAKAVLDENSTCEMSRQFGAWIDVWNQAETDAVVSQDGHTLSEMSEAEIQGVIAAVGDRIAAAYSNFPGGRPLVDTLFEELEAAKAN